MKKIFLTFSALAMAVGSMFADEVVYNFASPTDGLYGLNLAAKWSDPWQALPHIMTNGPVSAELSCVNYTGETSQYGFQLIKSMMNTGLTVKSCKSGSAVTSDINLTCSAGNITGVTIAFQWPYMASNIKELSFNGVPTSFNNEDEGLYIWSGDTGAVKVAINSDVSVYIKSITVEYAGGGSSVELQDPQLSFDTDEFIYYQSGDNDPYPVLNNPNNVPVTWSSSNTDVAWFMGGTQLFAMAPGETVITAKSSATSEFAAGEASYKLIVKREKAGEDTVSFPETLDITTTAASAEWSSNFDYGLLTMVGKLQCEGNNVNITVNTPEGWGAVYYVEPKGDVAAQSLDGIVPMAESDEEYGDWVSPSVMTGSIGGIKGNTFTIPADGVTYEYSIYLQADNDDEANVYLAKHAMVSVTAFPPFAAPSNLTVTPSETLNVNVEYVDQSDDYNFPVINVSALVENNTPEALGFTFDIPVGWDSMYLLVQNMGGGSGPDLLAGNSVVALTDDDEEFGWTPEADILNAGYVNSRMFQVSTAEAGNYMVTIMLGKEGRVATSKPYALFLDLQTEKTPPVVYQPKEYKLVLGGITYDMTFTGVNEINNSGDYTVTVECVEKDATIVVTDGENAQYTVLGELVLNNEFLTFMTPLGDDVDPGHLNVDAVNVTFTFNDNPSLETWTLAASGDEYVAKPEPYVSREFNIVIGGFPTQMIFEKVDANNGGIYTALVDVVSSDDSIIITDGEDKAYTISGVMDLNAESEAYLTPYVEGDEAGHLSTAAEYVTFTFVDNPGSEIQTLKAIGTELVLNTEWVLATADGGMLNLIETYSQEADAANGYDDFVRYEANIPTLMKSTGFYVKNTKTGAMYSSGSDIEINGAYPSYLMNTEEQSWMHINVNAENAVVTFENHVNYEMMTLSVTGSEGVTSSWVLVLNDEDIPFNVKSADIANEDYEYELTLPALTPEDQFYVYNTADKHIYTNGSVVTVNNEYPDYLFWAEEVMLMKVGGKYSNVTVTFHNNVSFEITTLAITGIPAGNGDTKGYYLKGNVALNGNGDFSSGENIHAFTKLADHEIWTYGPVEFGAFKSFAVWGGENNSWYSTTDSNPGWKLPSLAAEQHYGAYEVSELYAMQPAEQGTYHIVLDMNNPVAPKLALTKDLDNFFMITGVNAVVEDDADAIYYDLNGNRLSNPEKGIYIKVSGGKTTKVLVK